MVLKMEMCRWKAKSETQLSRLGMRQMESEANESNEIEEDEAVVATIILEKALTCSAEFI